MAADGQMLYICPTNSPRKGLPPSLSAPLLRATRQGLLPTGCRVGFSRRTATNGAIKKSGSQNALSHLQK